MALSAAGPVKGENAGSTKFRLSPMRQPSDVAVLTEMPFWGGLIHFSGHLMPSGSVYGESRFIQNVTREIKFRRAWTSPDLTRGGLRGVKEEVRAVVDLNPLSS